MGARFRCLLTGDPMDDEHIKSEGKVGGMGGRLIAIVAEGSRGRVYLPATPAHEHLALRARPESNVEESLDYDPRALWTPPYGLATFGDLFTLRQLAAMVTLSGLVKAIREDVRQDAAAMGLSDEEAQAYALTVTTFLALALDRCADFNNALCGWSSSNQKVMHLFGRQAIPMVW